MDPLRTLLAIAKLAAEGAEQLLPPPHTEAAPGVPPETAPKVKRKVRRKRAKRIPKFKHSTPLPPDPLPTRVHSSDPMTDEAGSWRNRPRNKRYECTACHHRFQSKLPLLDVTCPECSSTDIIKQQQERSLA